MANTKRVDFIWDRYLPDSLKATTRQRRGAGIRQRMRHGGNGKFPRNWNSYLQNASNKVELFRYLSAAIAQTVFCEGKVVISTLDEDVLGSPLSGADESEYPLRPCSHEELDTRMMLHAANAVSHGYKRILIIANDTDIIVLGISFFNDIGADKLWVSFGIGNKLRNISTHDICSTMSSTKAKALSVFHALTGTDNTSFFSGTGKKSAYAKWSTLPELKTTLCHLMDKPETPSSDDIAVIESFVISLYWVSCTLTDVNQALADIRSIVSHF